MIKKYQDFLHEDSTSSEYIEVSKHYESLDFFTNYVRNEIKKDISKHINFNKTFDSVHRIDNGDILCGFSLEVQVEALQKTDLDIADFFKPYYL